MKIIINLRSWVLLIWFLLGSIISGCGNAEIPNLDGILVHIIPPISGEKILPTTATMPGKRGGTISIVAARGEFEPASFVLKAVDKNIEALTLVPTNLISQTSMIPPSNIDIKVVKVWYQAAGAWESVIRDMKGSQVLVPELLLNDDSLIQVDTQEKKNFARVVDEHGSRYEWINEPKTFKGLIADNWHASQRFQDYLIKDASSLFPVNLEKDRLKQFWITVHVPQEASPGLYTGKVMLGSGGVTLGSIKIELQVLPFDLAEARLIYSIYYRGQLFPGFTGVSSEYKTKNQLRAELKDMRSHGVKNPTVYQAPRDRSLFRDVLNLRHEAGMGGQPLYLCGLNTSLYSRNSEDLSRLKRDVVDTIGTAKQFGLSTVYIYGRDEASGGALLAEREAWKVIHEAGGKVFVAGSTGAFEAVGDLLDLSINFGKPLPAEALKFHGVGHQIFNYSNPQVGPENPLIFRRNYGIVLWAADYDGALPYAYQDCGGSCWNDMDNPTYSIHPTYRDHMFAYPTADGVIDTIAWEGFREAVDDVRYLTTLENYTNMALRSRNLKLRQLGKKAGLFLDAVRQSVVQAADMPIDPDAIRHQVIDQILSLKQVLEASR